MCKANAMECAVLRLQNIYIILFILFINIVFVSVSFVQHIPATWTWRDLNWKNVWFFAYLHAGSAYALYFILTGQAKLLTVLFGKCKFHAVRDVYEHICSKWNEMEESIWEKKRKQTSDQKIEWARMREWKRNREFHIQCASVDSTAALLTQAHQTILFVCLCARFY